MKKDDLRTFITIVIICAIIVGLVLILNRKSNSEKLEVVNEYNSFFGVTNYANNYLFYSDASKLYDIIYSNYIDNNSITVDNIFDIINKYPTNTSIKVVKMEYVKVKGNYIYYLEGKINQNIMDGNKLIDDNFRMLVLLDFDNISYALYPLDSKDNYKKIIDKIKRIEIESNNNNELVDSSLISKEQICVFYLSDYIEKINNNIEEAYNLLDDNKKKNYTLDDFKENISNNYDKITTRADKCLMDNVGSNRLYTVIDYNNNKYVFNEKNILNYTVSIYFDDDSLLEDS